MTKKKELNPKQQYFCELYATQREFFGNGYQAYVEAYDVDTSTPGKAGVARSCASMLLTKQNILAEIRNLMDTAILNEEFVDNQLAFIIEQNADMSTKMAAIKEFNKLRQRITEKIAHKHEGLPTQIIIQANKKDD